MKGSDRSKHRIWDTILPLLLCACFIASSLLFLVQMIRKNQGENIEALYNAAEQKKTTIIKQIQGDLQTLEGLAVILGEIGGMEREQLLPILQEINNDNAFIRMGFARPDGSAWLVDLDGSIYEISFRDMEFFQNALHGTSTVSDIYQDERRKDCYVNYYGVNIPDPEGGTTGVLCAVHSADVLRRILDAPVLSGQGFSNIVNGDGDYVLRSINAYPGDILPENRELIREAVGTGGTASFDMLDRTGRKQVSVIIPLLEGRWYLHSMVPDRVLRARYTETAAGIMTIIVVSCCLFALFLSRQRSMAARTQKMLMDLAYRDSLTGLRNFDGFKLDVKPFIERNDLSSYLLWYGDLKKFKFINDILGYEEGDKILRLISEYLKGLEDKDCIVCRISADNFAGIVKYEDQGGLNIRFQGVLDHIKNAGVESQAFIELSVGIYRLSPGDEKLSMDVLMNYANMAHKIAKEKPGSNIALYDSGLRKRQIEDSILESEAEKAIKAGEFKVYMQPKVNIQNNNCLSGAEALVRWLSPSRGLVPPDRFISLFEKSGRIVMLDRYMFEQVCRWYREYLDKGGHPISIAVNVSKVGLLQKDFIQYYSETKKRFGIPDRCLELEFTEGVLLNDTDMFSDIVRQLQSNGFTCSLDDFGSGYSSLNLLKNLPIDVLKLDIMFFHKSRDMGRERIVISNFIHMAKELNIKTIAEGVEDRDSVEFLRHCGCDVVQGYTFFKPMPLEEFDRLVKEQGRTPLVPKDV